MENFEELIVGERYVIVSEDTFPLSCIYKVGDIGILKEIHGNLCFFNMYNGGEQVCPIEKTLKLFKPLDLTYYIKRTLNEKV